MYFLIEYDRERGELVTFREFDEGRAAEADMERLHIELELHARGVNHEVVVLQAENKESIRKTHGRYFCDVPVLARQLCDEMLGSLDRTMKALDESKSQLPRV